MLRLLTTLMLVFFFAMPTHDGIAETKLHLVKVYKAPG